VPEPELALVQELEQERALRQQELAQVPAPAQLVPAQQHHSQPPRRQ
jgi:hypothetical protein